MRRAFRAVVAGALATTFSFVLAAAPAHADRFRDMQWHLTYLDIATAHQHSQGAGITVAILDSGVEAEHPDLAGNVLPGVDVVPGGNGNGWGDAEGHGTSMAGLVAAHGHGSGNADGVLGIAPKAKILPIRIGIGSRQASAAEESRAIDEAVDRGAKIISISAATGDVFDAVERAVDANVLIFAAAGNTTQENLIGSPASYSGVVAVTAIGPDGILADISVTGPKAELAAPGVDIVSSSYIASDGSMYRKGTGTSPATAIVAGVAALVWSKYPDLTAEQVREVLRATADDKGPAGRDNEYGFGVADPVRALTAPLPSPSDPSFATTGPALPTPPSAEPEPGGALRGLLLPVGGGLVLLLIVAGLVLTLRRRGSRTE